MKQRCENPNDKGYRNYGARGIRFEFASVTEAGLWIMENLGLQQHLELDRIDNNGHYAAGNLRYATREEQSRNKRNSKLSQAQADWCRGRSPFFSGTSEKLMKSGMSETEIIERAMTLVKTFQGKWPSVLERLVSRGYMTLSSADQIIASRCQASSSTTAATAAARVLLQKWERFKWAFLNQNSNP
jgi:hypothetical protein